MPRPFHTVRVLYGRCDTVFSLEHALKHTTGSHSLLQIWVSTLFRPELAFRIATDIVDPSAKEEVIISKSHFFSPRKDP